jgi:hypothetical protein
MGNPQPDSGYLSVARRRVAYMIQINDKARGSFLKKRTKKLFSVALRYSRKSFCFFFQKEALSYY